MVHAHDEARFRSLFGQDSLTHLQCPVREECRSTFSYHSCFSLVAHLNDRHRWTRERIANYLDLLDLDLSVRA